MRTKVQRARLRADPGEIANLFMRRKSGIAPRQVLRVGLGGRVRKEVREEKQQEHQTAGSRPARLEV